MSTIPETALLTILKWKKAALAVGVHIVGCSICSQTEMNATLRHTGTYCDECNALWSAAMSLEAEVIAMVPTLEAAGIDVLEVCGDFQFLTENQA